MGLSPQGVAKNPGKTGFFRVIPFTSPCPSLMIESEIHGAIFRRIGANQPCSTVMKSGRAGHGVCRNR
jgi:hypothetical protein